MFTPQALTVFEQAVGDLGKINTEGMEYADRADATSIRNRRILDAAQVVVNVLTDDNGRRYTVRVAPDHDENIASTDLVGAKMVVTSAPLRDTELTAAEAATIMTAFVVHEIGHANYTPPLRAAQNERWPGKVLPKRIGNIFDDGNIEAKLVRRYPGVTGVFDIGLEWVGKKSLAAHIEEHGPLVWPTTGTVAERMNFVSAATRYRNVSVVAFATDPDTDEARGFFGALYESIDADTTTDRMIEIIELAMHKIRQGATAELPPDGPGPNTTTCPPIIDLPPQPGPATDDMDDDEDQPEPPKGENPGGDDDGGDEPTDDDPPKGDGKGKGDDTEGEDEDSDEEPKGSTEGDDDADEDGDEPTEGDDDDPDGPDGDDDDDPEDRHGDEEGKYRDESPDPDSADDTEGKGEDITTNPYANDVDLGFDPEGVDDTMDDMIERTEGADHRVQSALDIERSSIRLTDAEFGTMKVVIQ